MPRNFFRYLLPDKAPADQHLIYIPYWRFRGMMFSCVAKGILSRFVDVSQLALMGEHAIFPGSLGLRSQAMKLKFVTPETDGTFIKSDIDFRQALSMFESRFNATRPGEPILREYIGETTSLIYAPCHVRDRIYDAVLNEPYAEAPQPHLRDVGDWPQCAQEGRNIRFQATLCPACGWDMEGERDSQVLSCRNCDSVWQPTARRFVQLKFGHVPAATEDPVRFFPFWRIRCRITGVELESAADLIRLANLPKVAQPSDQSKAFYFWSPAFKVPPQAFLRLAGSVTLAQPDTDSLTARLPDGRPHAVNLPVTEAAESLKITLAGFIKPRRHLFPRLKEISIRPLGFKLVYIPFTEGHHEYIHPHLKTAINKNMLNLSDNL